MSYYVWVLIFIRKLYQNKNIYNKYEILLYYSNVWYKAKQLKNI